MPTSRATRVTSSAKDESWSTIPFTVVPIRRNSPRTGWPSISSWIRCDRSPSATASITRATSIVGRARLSISSLTAPIFSAHEPGAPRDVRPLVDPAFAPDDLADPDELPRHLLIALDERVERGCDLGERAFRAQAHGEVAVARGPERGDELVELGLRQRC